MCLVGIVRVRADSLSFCVQWRILHGVRQALAITSMLLIPTQYSVSEELNLAANHLIAPNGYNLGRDHMVGNLTAQENVIPTLNLTNTSTYSGSSSWANYTYETSVKYISGLLQNSSEGINHPDR
jgi:hypothetical protein